MSPSSSSDETAVSSASSEEDDDISLPPSPSPSPEPSPEPYESSSEDAPAAVPAAKKPRRPRTGTGPRPRSWPSADEVVLLEAVIAHQERHGRLPSRDDLAAALAGRLRYSGEQAAERVSNLRNRYYGSVRRLSRGTVPVTDGDMRVYRLSKRLWEGTVAERARRRERRAADKAAARHHERRGFAELEALYPCLAAEVAAIAARRPCGALKTALGMIGDERAAALDARVRRQRRAEMKARMRRDALRDQVARTLLEFIK